MKQSDNPFTHRLERWKNEQATPWAQLKYRLVAANLAPHLPSGPLQILDAGGGNGVEALAFARAGHKATLVDSSAAMLAEARSTAAALDLSGHLRAVELDLAALPEQFPVSSFDLVLCHNVLQYMSDMGQLLDRLLAVLRPGGVLSLVSVNRYSVPYQVAFLHRDLQGAYASLDDHVQRASIFDTPMTLYTAEEIAGLLAARGVARAHHYEIRCLCDYWGDNAEKAQPEVMAQLERLEHRLTDREPYKQLARYFQLVARQS